MAFTIPSPFATAPAPLEGEVMLSEAGLPNVLTRAAELLARMRADRDSARAAAASALGRLEAAAAQVTEAQRDLATAAVPVAKATGDVQRARRAGDQEGHHWGRRRLEAARHALRAAEEQARDRMADHAEIVREGAIAMRRAEFLDASIVAAERAAVRLAASVDAPGGPSA